MVHFLNGHTFELLVEKAIHWSSSQTLIIADLHFGKVTHFRKNGLPIPIEAESNNYDRLAYLLLNKKIKRVLLLGDLFHSEMNDAWIDFKNFLSKFEYIQFVLILGNHDILDPKEYILPNLSVKNQLIEEGFLFTHEPIDKKGGDFFNFCGHIHPAVVLEGHGKQRLKLPCYYFNEYQCILPAFGEFTGTHVLEIEKKAHIYVVAESEVIRMS